MPRFLLKGSLSLPHPLFLSPSPLFTGGDRKDESPRARLREWPSHSPSTALTHPLSPSSSSLSLSQSLD